MSARTTTPLLWLLMTLSACAGAGPYGFAREYTPLDAERDHFERATRQIAFEDVQRDPDSFTKSEVGWFGVVTSYADLPGGGQRLGLSMRNHQPRHLCGTAQAASCRVTVSDRSMGIFVMDVSLSPEEQNGKDRVWVGSLLKVYGTPTGEYDQEGGPVIKPAYYRHFPRGTYVTTAQRAAMRR